MTTISGNAVISDHRHMNGLYAVVLWVHLSKGV